MFYVRFQIHHQGECIASMRTSEFQYDCEYPFPPARLDACYRENGTLALFVDKAGMYFVSE